MAEPTPKDHAGCADWLRSHFINDGIDVVISTEPFLVVGPYTLVDGEPCSMTCHTERRSTGSRPGIRSLSGFGRACDEASYLSESR